MSLSVVDTITTPDASPTASPYRLSLIASRDTAIVRWHATGEPFHLRPGVGVRPRRSSPTPGAGRTPGAGLHPTAGLRTETARDIVGYRFRVNGVDASTGRLIAGRGACAGTFKVGDGTKAGSWRSRANVPQLDAFTAAALALSEGATDIHLYAYVVGEGWG